MKVEGDEADEDDDEDEATWGDGEDGSFDLLCFCRWSLPCHWHSEPSFVASGLFSESFALRNC